MIRNKIKPYFYLFSFFYIFRINRIFWFLSKYLAFSLICFLVKKDRYNKIFLSFANFRNLKELYQATLNLIFFCSLAIIYFDNFGIIAKIIWVISWKFNQREVLFVEITSCLIFFMYSNLYKRRKGKEYSFSFIDVNFVHHLKKSSRRRKAYRIYIIKLFFCYWSLLFQAVD